MMGPAWRSRNGGAAMPGGIGPIVGPGAQDATLAGLWTRTNSAAAAQRRHDLRQLPAAVPGASG
jgi:hypothetical protein